MKKVHIVGVGLAGSEAAWQFVQLGIPVTLHEMKPQQYSPAHRTPFFAELVCSNSLKSLLPGSAPHLLKEEMRKFDSLVLETAFAFQVPAGGALAVDREKFSQEIHRKLTSHPLISLAPGEVATIPDQETLDRSNEYWLIATGPLTSDALAQHLMARMDGVGQLYFYDSIAPVLSTDTLDPDHYFRASRYDKGGDDYINIPLDRGQYETLIEDIRQAEKMDLHAFEEPKYFESCLPIEVMIDRGPETLRFGPMKPVGLRDPKTGYHAHAIIQLRAENLSGTMHSMVGFQTKMKWPEQKRVFSKLPALRDAEFLRFGSIHRNTYVQGPKVLANDLSLRSSPNIFLGGQITGVEGYLESAAMGLLAARFLAGRRNAISSFVPPPAGTVMGALLDYVTASPTKDFVPMNANLGLLPPMQKARGVGKAERKDLQCRKALELMGDYSAKHLSPSHTST